MILPDTSIEGAVAVARMVLDHITDLQIPHEGSEVAEHLTMSIGVATMSPVEAQKPEELVRAADQILSLAKDHGRNRIEVDSPEANLTRASL